MLCMCACWLLFICLVHHVLCVYLFPRAWCHDLSLSVSLSLWVFIFPPSLSSSVFSTFLFFSLPPSSLPCLFSFHLSYRSFSDRLPSSLCLFRDLIVPPIFLPVIGVVCAASSVIPRPSHSLMQSSLLAPLCLSFVCMCLLLICLLVCILPLITSYPIFMVIIYSFIICFFLTVSAVPNFSLPSATSLVH